jgi:aflatoxin B1 aldehyde reductase
MTFGWNQSSSAIDKEIATAMVKTFSSSGGLYLDTARIYSGGMCESIVGDAVKGFERGSLRIGSKASPSQAGGLSANGIQSQLDTSLKALGTPSLSEYYLHQPDTEHSLLESLQKAHDLVQEGLIENIGLSNYHADEVHNCFRLCETHGLTKPSVYQGLYNPLNRLVEDDLFSVLRENNCSFIAYNPLAAGLLSGKHFASGTPGNQDSAGNGVLPGRFRENPNYLPRYYTTGNIHTQQLQFSISFLL